MTLALTLLFALNLYQRVSRERTENQTIVTHGPLSKTR